MSSQAIATRPVDKLKAVLSADSVKQQFENALARESGPFVASLIELFGNDAYLQQCDPNKVVMEALKAASLKLPINKSLGFASIIGRKVKGEMEPQFQIDYKGYIQLAQRSGQIINLNAGPVPVGLNVEHDFRSGETNFTGEPTGDEAQGYFAYVKLASGFEKTAYMTTEEIQSHGKRYSAAYERTYSPWKTEFPKMATKTVLKQLISKYCPLSIELQQVFINERYYDDDGSKFEGQIELVGDDNINLEAGEIIEDAEFDEQASLALDAELAKEEAKRK